MHPVLVRLRIGSGHFEVHSFGVLVAAGCAAAILFALREARRRGVDEDAVRDLCFWTLVLSLLGARVVYVASAGRLLLEDCADAFAGSAGLRAIADACTRPLRVWEGGLVFYGGLVAGALTALLYARRRGVSPLVAADILAPSLALGHAIGRLGCFLAGCCFGKPTDGALGVRFGEGSAALADLVARGALPTSAHYTPPLHPTQIYEATGELALFFLLLRLAPRLPRPGDLTLVWLGAYSALRFAIEVLRGDLVRAFAVEIPTPSLNALLGLPPGEASFLSTGQASAIAVLAFVAAAAAARRWRAKRDGRAARLAEPPPTRA